MWAQGGLAHGGPHHAGCFRYLKYLTKKFLAKKGLRDAFQVVAVNASSYKLKWFDLAEADEDAE